MSVKTGPRSALIISAILASACGGDDDHQAHEYIQAVREHDDAFCVSCGRRDPEQCVPSEAAECSYEVRRKHAGELGVSLECLTHRAMELTRCIREAGCDDVAVALNRCAMRIPSCGVIRASAVEAINAELERKCTPLARCSDGSKPMKGPGGQLGCPVFLDAGSPPPSCSAMLSEMNGDLVTQACAECICEAVPDAPFICDESCWQLIACVESACPTGIGDAGECISEGCGALLSNLSAATDLFTKLGGRSCSPACSALGL